MLRAGQVAHSGGWRWYGYREVAGLRRRYRILDRECLVEKPQARHFGEIRETWPAPGFRAAAVLAPLEKSG